MSVPGASAVGIIVTVLILFDIDGTLLLGAPRAHAEALARAAEDVWGVPATAADVAAVVPAGRTDREIARLVARRHDLPDDEITTGMGAWMERVAEVFPALDAARPPQAVAPGAGEALRRVARSAELALLTGNIEALAHAKLARAGLGRWFPRGRGAFGSDHESREALVPIAARRSGGAADIVVVGDTPRDVACARAAGARCVAVTTGAHGPEDLAGADAVAGGLEEAADLLTTWRRQSPAPATTRS